MKKILSAAISAILIACTVLAGGAQAGTSAAAAGQGNAVQTAGTLTKNYTLRKIKCKPCNGTKKVKCTTCKNGKIRVQSTSLISPAYGAKIVSKKKLSKNGSTYMYTWEYNCRVCDGTGKKPCTKCNTKGWVYG